VLAGYTSGFYGGAAAATAAAATANAGLYDMVAVGLSGSKGKLLWVWQVGGEQSLQNVLCFGELFAESVQLFRAIKHCY
jgi:hypothetical protein